MMSPGGPRSAPSAKRFGFCNRFPPRHAAAGQTWFSVYWEPLWAELEETGMTVGFHECTNSGHYPHLERFGIGNRLLRHVCTHVTGQMVTMVDIILGGVLERFPQLQSRVPGMQLRLGALLAPTHGPPLGAAGKK